MAPLVASGVASIGEPAGSGSRKREDFPNAEAITRWMPSGCDSSFGGGGLGVGPRRVRERGEEGGTGWVTTGRVRAGQ